jgi:hypothetical protein
MLIDLLDLLDFLVGLAQDVEASMKPAIEAVTTRVTMMDMTGTESS